MKMKTISLTVLLVTFLVFIPVVNVLAQSDPSTLYLSGGIYPNAPSFTFWREGNYYYAKNPYGFLSYSGTNLTQICENVISTLTTSGGTLYFSKGTYVFSGQLTINYPAISIIGEAGGIDAIDKATYFCFQGINGIVVNENGASYVPHVQIKNVLIDGVDESGEYGVQSWGRYLVVEDVEIISFQTGISLEWSGSWSVGDSWLNRVVCRNMTYEGIKINSNDNQATNIYCHYCQQGLYLIGHGGLLGTNVHLWGNTDNGLKIVQSANDQFLTLYTETNGGSGVHIGSTTGNVQNIKFVNLYSWGNTVSAIEMSSASHQIGNVSYIGGRVEGSVSIGSGVYDTKIYNMEGYITENCGSATISASTSVVVNHGLAGTPDNVVVTLGTSGAGDYYVDTLTSTQFTVHVANSGTYTVYWSATYQPT